MKATMADISDDRMRPASEFIMHSKVLLGAEHSSAANTVPKNIRLTASVANFGDSIEVRRNEFNVAVYVEDGPPIELTVSSPCKADRKLIQATGEVCLLGPGTTMACPASPCQLIQYRIPAEAIRSLASHWKLGRYDSLKAPLVSVDPVLHRLSRVMSHLLVCSQTATPIVKDQFVRSFYSHLLQHYGMGSREGSTYLGGLSPHHKRIVEDSLSGPLPANLKIKEIADRCGISAGHFARVFRQSFGKSFHQQVMHIRIERAKNLLQSSPLSLGEIAQKSGYADQATFTASFARVVSTSPGRFRRQHAAC
jgi:AraC-like DNA-binding protein